MKVSCKRGSMVELLTLVCTDLVWGLYWPFFYFSFFFNLKLPFSYFVIQFNIKTFGKKYDLIIRLFNTFVHYMNELAVTALWFYFRTINSQSKYTNRAYDFVNMKNIMRVEIWLCDRKSKIQHGDGMWCTCLKLCWNLRIKYKDNDQSSMKINGKVFFLEWIRKFSLSWKNLRRKQGLKV